MGNVSVFGQNDLKNIPVPTDVPTDTIKDKINLLRPARAAFYSAILPGLGQAYNKKYWKMPIVYGALGVSIYSYVWNKNKYDSYRDAYKERLLVGNNSTDPYLGVLPTEKLIDAQKYHERNRDLSLLVTAAIYILNIIDANVDGHLKQFNVNGKLTVRPDLSPNDYTSQQNVGLTLNYNF
jgi:Family of unknown function (DUF5683)